MAMLAPEHGAYSMPSVLPTTVVLHPDVMVERLKQQQVIQKSMNFNYEPSSEPDPRPALSPSSNLEINPQLALDPPAQRHPQSSDWAIAPRPEEASSSQRLDSRPSP